MSRPDLLDELPPPSQRDWLAEIRSMRSATNRKIVVLDDDPTGTQTVHGVDVLMDGSVDALRRQLKQGQDLFYVLTNSRSLVASEAEQLTRQIAGNLLEASNETGVPISVISRSDSTLRGHYPLEVQTLAEALGWEDTSIEVLCPFFEEGGRRTFDNEHYVVEGSEWIPASKTPFAKDASFGYQSSCLPEYVQEKYGEGFDRQRILCIAIEELRSKDVDAISERLVDADPGSVVIVNAVDMQDVRAFAAAALRAEHNGRKIIYRTAASFVQAFAGLSSQPLLQGDALRRREVPCGLVVVGSYVPKATQQLQRLLSDTHEELESIVLNVDALISVMRNRPNQGGLNDDPVHHLVLSAVDAIQAAISRGRHAVLSTSRTLITGNDQDGHLDIGNKVSQTLVQIVSKIDGPLRFLMVKGGITSSDVATEALAVRRAEVLGQILPGVPVWKLDEMGHRPGLPYVVFPGNVGDDDALLEAYRKLS